MAFVDAHEGYKGATEKSRTCSTQRCGTPSLLGCLWQISQRGEGRMPKPSENLVKQGRIRMILSIVLAVGCPFAGG